MGSRQGLGRGVSSSVAINVDTAVVSANIFCNVSRSAGAFDGSLTIMCNICVNPNFLIYQGVDHDHVDIDWIGEAITHLVKKHPKIFEPETT